MKRSSSAIKTNLIQMLMKNFRNVIYQIDSRASFPMIERNEDANIMICNIRIFILFATSPHSFTQEENETRKKSVLC